MTAPALPGAAPDPVPGHAPGRNDPARLPPEVEKALSLALSDAPARGTCDELLLRTAIARALGGDGEPVAWGVFDCDRRIETHRGTEAEARNTAAAWNGCGAEGSPFTVAPLFTRPAATGDTGAVERAARTAALYVDEAWRKGAPKSEWHPIKAMLMRDAIRAATGGHPSEARRGHESEGRGGPDAR